MNVRLLFTLLIICLSLSGCSDELTLENAATPLAHGKTLMSLLPVTDWLNGICSLRWSQG